MSEHLNGADAQKVLRVCMFGGFSMALAGRKIVFARTSNTKFIQLLQLLFLHNSDGISKKELIENLYGWDAGVNPNKNLNNVIYRLKKQLVSSGFPEEDYVLLENGVCRWNSSFSVDVDVVLFSDYIAKAEKESGEKRILLLKQAEQLYTGEFLPEYSTELWVIEKALQFKNWYEAIVKKIGESLRQSGQFREEIKLYQKAAKLYPYDEWQMQEIDCLMLSKEYKEAYAVYQNTAKLYCEELGIPPGPEMVKRLRLLEQQIKSPVGSFEDLRKNFKEIQSTGAYYCLYPSFLDSCQLLARVSERSGKSVFLMLVNLTGKLGKEITDLDKLGTQMKLLKGIIQMSLRCGDLFTTYSRCQYMLILVGTEHENCNKVFTRILEQWKNKEGARGELSYSVESLVKMLSPELTGAEEAHW